MEWHCSNEPLGQVAADWLVVGLASDEEFSPRIAELDEQLGGMLSRMRSRGDLKARHGSLCELLDVPALSAQRLLLVGLGERAAIDRRRYLLAMQEAARKVCRQSGLTVAVGVSAELGAGLDESVQAELVGTAWEVGGVGPGLRKADRDRHPLEALTLVGDQSSGDALSVAVERGLVVGESINLARELVNLPPNEIYPQSFAERAEHAAAAAGLGCEVLDERRLEEERMGSLLAVAQGSVQPPRVVVLTHRGGAADAPALAIVGKGVTFDSGGLSLKPSDGMKTMKCDMAGGATVVGVLSAVARLQLPVNVIGLVGLVENMPSGQSYKLGDVLTARNGVTIEVHNTDAEGRLVLADVLNYATSLGADRMVDLATLTGACVVALGMHVTGAFSNDDTWQTQVLEAVRDAGEEAWPLPMYDSFNDQLKSDVADVKNVGTRWGGAITAAKFLERFVEDTPWVHLDIAGPSFAESSRTGVDSGATGVMVRGLVELCRRAV